MVDWKDCPIGARIEQKIDDLTDAVKGKNGLCELIGRQNGRVRKNEIKIAILYAGVTILAFVVPIVAPLIWNYIIGVKP